MSSSRPNWSGSPEYRIIRELRETRIGGLAPGTQGREYGRVFETILIRELQILARKHTDTELRFARGYVVEDYGNPESGEVSLDEGEKIQPTGPRFDIVCYHGTVAWTANEGIPFAVVPKSLAYGVIEAKRTISPKRFGPDSNEFYNNQLKKQRKYLEGLESDIYHVVVGAHFFGSPEENRQKAITNYVAALGELKHKGSARKMAQTGELQNVIDVMLGGHPSNVDEEKMNQLADIASQISEKDNKTE